MDKLCSSSLLPKVFPKRWIGINVKHSFTTHLHESQIGYGLVENVERTAWFYPVKRIIISHGSDKNLA